MTQLWSMAGLAGLLSTMDGLSQCVTIMPQPSLARLRSMMKTDVPSLDLVPAWFLDSLPHSDFPNWHNLQMRSEGYAAKDNRDEWVCLQPLNALISGTSNKPFQRRLRQIDFLAQGLRKCDLLMIGSGEQAGGLLAGATGLIERHRPIVVVDLGSDRQADGILALLPGWHRLAPPDKPHAGRFMVATSSPCNAEFVEPCVEVGNIDLADPGLVASMAKRGGDSLHWNEQSPGIILVVDRPAAARSIKITLNGNLPHGIRVLLGEHRLTARLRRSKTNVEIAARLPNHPHDGLEKLVIAPARLTTTESLGALELLSLYFEFEDQAVG